MTVGGGVRVHERIVKEVWVSEHSFLINQRGASSVADVSGFCDVGGGGCLSYVRDRGLRMCRIHIWSRSSG